MEEYKDHRKLLFRRKLQPFLPKYRRQFASQNIHHHHARLSRRSTFRAVLGPRLRRSFQHRCRAQRHPYPLRTTRQVRQPCRRSAHQSHAANSRPTSARPISLLRPQNFTRCHPAQKIHHSTSQRITHQVARPKIGGRAHQASFQPEGSCRLRTQPNRPPALHPRQCLLQCPRLRHGNIDLSQPRIWNQWIFPRSPCIPLIRIRLSQFCPRVFVLRVCFHLLGPCFPLRCIFSASLFLKPAPDLWPRSRCPTPPARPAPSSP